MAPGGQAATLCLWRTENLQRNGRSLQILVGAGALQDCLSVTLNQIRKQLAVMLSGLHPCPPISSCKKLHAGEAQNSSAYLLGGVGSELTSYTQGTRTFMPSCGGDREEGALVTFEQQLRMRPVGGSRDLWTAVPVPSGYSLLSESLPIFCHSPGDPNTVHRLTPQEVRAVSVGSFQGELCPVPCCSCSGRTG